jgi:hypothetical protein
MHGKHKTSKLACAPWPSLLPSPSAELAELGEVVVEVALPLTCAQCEVQSRASACTCSDVLCFASIQKGTNEKRPSSHTHSQPYLSAVEKLQQTCGPDAAYIHQLAVHPAAYALEGQGQCHTQGDSWEEGPVFVACM